jgi:hypothetical protein
LTLIDVGLAHPSLLVPAAIDPGTSAVEPGVDTIAFAVQTAVDTLTLAIQAVIDAIPFAVQALIDAIPLALQVSGPVLKLGTGMKLCVSQSMTRETHNFIPVPSFTSRITGLVTEDTGLVQAQLLDIRTSN